MDIAAILSAILALVTVVNGVCDRNAVAGCSQKMTGGGSDVNAMCELYNEFQVCIDPLRTECESDVVWSGVQMVETTYSGVCGGSSGTGGSGCSFTGCMTILQKYKSEGSNQPIEATTEFCVDVKEFEKCVNAAKPSCPEGDEMVASADTMLNSYNVMCGGCSSSKMLECMKPVQGLVSDEFEGYPSEAQLNAACPKMQDFKTCLSPIKAACASVGGEQGQMIQRGIETALQLVELMCGDEFKADFLKYGKECFDKMAYRNVTMECGDFSKPQTAPTSEPEPESKDVMCKRIMDSFSCYRSKTEGICSAEAKSFVEKAEGRLANVIAGGLGCPVSGVPQFAVQIWLLLALLLAAVFFH